MEYKISANISQKPNRGKVFEMTREAFDKAISAQWIADTVKQIREGKEELKNSLPFLCPHYFKFKDDHRAQDSIIAEEFTFETMIDYDEADDVEEVKQRALKLQTDTTSPWMGMMLRGTYSARKKLHIDIRIPLGMTIHEAQESYGKALGIEPDASCESPERMIYETGIEQEWYRSPEWGMVLSEDELAKRRKAYTDRGLSIDGFPVENGKTIYPTPEKAKKKAAKPFTAKSKTALAVNSAATQEVNGVATQKANVATNSEVKETAEAPIINKEEAQSANVKAFELCVEEAGLDLGDMDVEGVHNWHTNLLAVLSVGLCKMMDKAQVYAVVNKMLPNYSQTEDCAKLIESFYNKYEADATFMSVTQRRIFAEAQKWAKQDSQEGKTEPMADDANNNKVDEDADKDMEKLVEGWEPPTLPKKLPRLIELLVKPYPEKQHPMLIATAFTTLGAIASHFRALYIDDETVVGPNLFTAIVAGSGNGKKNVSTVFRKMTKDNLKAWDNREWEELRKNQEERDQKANAKDKPAKYHPKFRIMETMSKTSFLENQTNLGENGMSIGFYTEADGFVGSTKASFSNLSVLLRKGWDLDEYRQFYMSEASCNTQCQVNAAMIMTGTPKSVLGRVFYDVENGMMQRFIPVFLPKGKPSFRPPVIKRLTADEQAELDGLLATLWQRDLTIGDNTQMLEMPKTGKVVLSWFDEQEEKYNEGKLTDAEADLSHRVGQFMYRAMIPFMALYGEEKKEILDLLRWLGDYSYYNIRFLFGKRVQNDQQESAEMINQHIDNRKTVAPVFDKLPKVFTTKEFQKLRVEAGQKKNVRNLLSTYAKEGKIKRIDRGVYEKVG